MRKVFLRRGGHTELYFDWLLSMVFHLFNPVPLHGVLYGIQLLPLIFGTVMRKLLPLFCTLSRLMHSFLRKNRPHPVLSTESRLWKKKYSEKNDTYCLSAFLVSAEFWLPYSSQFEVSRFPYLNATERYTIQTVVKNKEGKALAK